MKKSILEIYALAVCFFTVACFVVVAGMALWSAVTLAAPEFTLNGYVWNHNHSDEAYKKYLVSQHAYGIDKQSYVPPEGAALTEARKSNLADAVFAERRTAGQDLVRYFIFLLVNGIVFLAHWKLASRSRQSAG